MTRSDAPRRALLRSGALVLGLVALSVLAGVASPASAAPSGPPNISNIGTLYPDSAPPSFLASTPDSDTIIHVDWYAVSGGTTVLDFCPGTSTFSGTTASCTGAANLTPGVYDVMGYSELGSDPGNFSPYSAAISVEVYGTAPGDFVSGPAVNSSDSTPTWTGTGPARGTVAVSADLGGTPLCSATVLNDGTWACTGSQGIGFYENVRLDAVDRFGSTSTDPGADFTITTIADSSITGVDGGGSPFVTGNTVPDLGGAQDPNADDITVQLTQDPLATSGIPYCHVSNAHGNATWGCSEPDNGLQHGDNYLLVSSANEHGDSSPNQLSFHVVLVDAPVITSPANNSFTNDITPLFSGTGEGTDADVMDASNITQCSANTGSGSWSCSTPPLSDGTYKFHVVVTPGTSLTTPDLTLTIDTVAPTAPAITSGDTTSTDRTPTISGTGEPFSTIQLSVNGSSWPCVGGNPLVDSGGAWSCTLANDLGVASYPVTVRQTDRAGNVSTASTSITVTVLPTLAESVAAPAPTTTPVPFTWQLGPGLPGELHPGDSVILSASNLPPGLAVDAEFHSTVVALGSTSVRTDGTFSLPVTVPDDAPLGLHHFVVTVWTPAGQAVVVEQPVTVIGFPKATSERVAQDGPAASAGGVQVDRNDPAAPSSFTHALNPIAAIFSNPVVIGIAAAAGLALFLLVAFPAELLNSTISEQYPRFAKRVPRAPWLQRFTDWIRRTPVFGGIAITVVAAVIFGFADPGFGFDLTSFRVVLACAIALFIVGYLASLMSGRIIRGRWKLDTVMELKPLGLILTVVGVVLSRLLEFSPGFLLGLILGISLVGSTTVAQRAKSTLVQAGVVFVLAILGWTLYSVLSAAGSPGDFGTALLFDTLVAITSEGLTAVFIGMLPVKFLDGPAVFEYSKPLWGVSFVVAAFAFVVVIVPSAWGELTGSLSVWIAIVGGFAVVALGIYLYFRFWAPAIDEGDDEEKALEFTQRNEP